MVAVRSFLLAALARLVLAASCGFLLTRGAANIPPRPCGTECLPRRTPASFSVDNDLKPLPALTLTLACAKHPPPPATLAQALRLAPEAVNLQATSYPHRGPHSDANEQGSKGAWAGTR